MTAHPVRTMVIDIVAPAALYYGIRAAGGGIWLALVAGGVVPVIAALAGLARGRKPDLDGLVMLAALTGSAALSLVTGSPRALLARDALVTAGWAIYLYLSLLGHRPVTFTISRALLKGRRVWDPAGRSWRRPSADARTWDQLWADEPRFRRIWRVCTVIWGSAILADAVLRAVIAQAAPIGEAPVLNTLLWPVTFVLLQVLTNVYFFRAGLWRLLLDDGARRTVSARRPSPAAVR